MSQIKDIEENIQEESTEITHPETLSVWGLAWPPIVGNLLFASVGVISIKAVGTLGAEAVAAVGTGQRMVWVFQALLMAVMTGTTALVARAVGSKNMIEAAHVTRLAIGVSIALSLITTLVIVLFAEKFIGIFGLRSSCTRISRYLFNNFNFIYSIYGNRDGNRRSIKSCWRCKNSDVYWYFY